MVEEKISILLVDDEKSFTDMVKLNLEATGEYVLKVENTGTGAIAAAKKFRPDLILLDIIMPDADGGTVLFGLQNEKDTKDIPVVFLTAIVSERDTERIDYRISGRPFLAKPVTTTQLIECIRRNVRK